MSDNYHHGNLRNALIEEGIRMINAGGEDSLSLRKLAVNCGVSNAAPYAHFKNKKENIMAEIEARVKAIIVDKLGVDESEVTNEANFANDLGADSLDNVELIMEFEKEFGIQIPDDQAEKIATVQDAIDFIQANQQ